MPDDRLRVAAKTLLATFSLRPLTPCPDSATCPASSPSRYTPPTAAHLHIEGVSEIPVGLYPQSDTLWFLPPLDDNSVIAVARGDAAANTTTTTTTTKVPPYFCLASDSTILPPWRPGRGSGVFQAGYHPVLVPRSHVLLEAFLRLYARDVSKRIGSFGMAMISYMEEYVDDDGLLKAELLPEPLKRLYGELRAGLTTMRQWTHDLQEALGVPLDEFDDK